jgi:hypothetical protein
VLNRVLALWPSSSRSFRAGPSQAVDDLLREILLVSQQRTDKLRALFTVLHEPLGEIVSFPVK